MHLSHVGLRLKALFSTFDLFSTDDLDISKRVYDEYLERCEEQDPGDWCNKGLPEGACIQLRIIPEICKGVSKSRCREKCSHVGLLR